MQHPYSYCIYRSPIPRIVSGTHSFTLGVIHRAQRSPGRIANARYLYLIRAALDVIGGDTFFFILHINRR